MTDNKYQHYLPEEDQLITELVTAGNEPWVIADKLQRTEVSLYYRRKKLGLDSGPWPMTQKYKRLKAIRTAQ